MLVQAGEMGALTKRNMSELQACWQPRPPSSATIRARSAAQEVKLTTGRTVLLVEVPRASPSQTPADLAALGVRLVSWGADALAVVRPPPQSAWHKAIALEKVRMPMELCANAPA